MEETARAQRLTVERKVSGKDPRSNWEIRREEEDSLSRVRRKQLLKEEFSEMQGRTPSLSPCGSKGLRFVLTSDGDFTLKLSEKGKKRRKRRGRKVHSKPKGQGIELARRSKRRRDKFDPRWSTPSSSEETA